MGGKHGDPPDPGWDDLLAAVEDAKTRLGREPLDAAAREAVLGAIAAAEVALRQHAATDSLAKTREEALRAQIGALQDAVAARDEFISIVGHELRNPLSAIFLQIKHLLDSSRRNPAAVTADWLSPRLESADRRLQRFLSILNRLLDVSRISSGRVHLDLEEVDLVEVVRDVCRALEPELSVAQSELRLRTAGPAVGRWDRMRLEQIVANLLSNAVRYGPGKPIEVDVVADDEVARVIVRDQGIGIADADQEAIFQLFERARTRQPGSFGVGLWLVRKLCRAMGGEVTLRSRVGAGSTFTATLPKRGRSR
jgi:signal transduction histidine kinase